jgi:hypothetical protein
LIHLHEQADASTRAGFPDVGVARPFADQVVLFESM